MNVKDLFCQCAVSLKKKKNTNSPDMHYGCILSCKCLDDCVLDIISVLLLRWS